MEYGAVVAWWVVLAAIAVAGLPIAATVLDRLPDRGAGVALPVGLVVLALPIYWLGHLSFGPVVIWTGALVLAALSAGLWRRRPDLDLGRFAEMLAVFSVGFLFLVGVRALDPSIHPAGGEKFLDFGLLKSLLEAGRLPPEDMWFAGEPVQYYYGGHLVSAALVTLAGVPARLGYNLALAGFYGTLVAAAYGLAGSIAATRGRGYRLAGTLGALFVGVASNPVATLQAVLWALPSSIARPIAEGVAGRSALETAALLDLGRGAPTPFYWISSRVIRGTITEFPLFAFLNGDLHAHMLSPPFLLLVAALSLAYVRTPPEDRRRRRALVFGAVPPVAGLVAVVNTWSFPSTAGVLWLAVLFGPDPGDLLPVGVGRRLLGDPTAGPWRREVGRLAVAAVAATAAALLGVLWVLPFFLGPATGASGRAIRLVADRSGLVEFLLVHGWLLLAFALYLGARVRGGGISVDSPTGGTTDLVGGRTRTLLLGGAVVVLALLADAAAFGLLLPMVLVGWLLLRRDAAGFETVLFVAGAGLVLLVEVVFLSEQAGPGRMNTVFKTYMQVWVLWGTAAAVAVVSMLPRAPAGERLPDRSAVALAVLVVSVSAYGALALGEHVSGADEPTLDATTWARETHPQEWPAISWLDDRRGQPTIVSAPGCWCNPRGLGPYSWVNAPSSFTGTPTLAGWSHEVGYRGREPYMRRVGDVRTIYTGTWTERRRLLRAYDVRYVYVGPTERALYGEDLASFDGRGGVRVAFESRAVTIYEVTPDGG